MSIEEIGMFEDEDYWLHSVMLCRSIDIATQNGLRLEFLMSFLESVHLGKNGIQESIGHAMREWDL